MKIRKVQVELFDPDRQTKFMNLIVAFHYFAVTSTKTEVRMGGFHLHVSSYLLIKC